MYGVLDPYKYSMETINTIKLATAYVAWLYRWENADV